MPASAQAKDMAQHRLLLRSHIATEGRSDERRRSPAFRHFASRHLAFNLGEQFEQIDVELCC